MPINDLTGSFIELNLPVGLGKKIMSYTDHPGQLGPVE